MMSNESHGSTSVGRMRHCVQIRITLLVSLLLDFLETGITTI